jgi:nitrous oxide reductase accessory protein NosL
VAGCDQGLQVQGAQAAMSMVGRDQGREELDTSTRAYGDRSQSREGLGAQHTAPPREKERASSVPKASGGKQLTEICHRGHWGIKEVGFYAPY